MSYIKSHYERTKSLFNHFSALAIQCILIITLFSVSHGQVPNFIETSISGLFRPRKGSLYRYQGVDLCRGLHETGYFNEFHDIHGPNAGYVFLVESDASTSVNQLYWNDSYVDNNYPIIDDADESVYNSYGGSGYPTVCLVCPDRTFYVEDDLYWSDIATYLERIVAHFNECLRCQSNGNQLIKHLLR